MIVLLNMDLFQTEMVEYAVEDSNDKFLMEINKNTYLWYHIEDGNLLRKVVLFDNPSLKNHFALSGYGGFYFPKNGNSNCYFFFNNSELIEMSQSIKEEMIEKMEKTFNKIDIIKNTYYQIIYKGKIIFYENDNYQDYPANFENIDNFCIIIAMFKMKYNKDLKIKIIKNNVSFEICFK